MNTFLTGFNPGLEFAHPALRIVLIWLLAWTLLHFLRKLLKLMRGHVLGRAREQTDYKRLETLSNVFRYASNIVILGMALMLTLAEVGISIAPILATAGVAGIAIGFGAQSLVKDFFTGLFLLLENQINEGDVIEAAGKSGYVERITLRHIRMRDYDGSVHFIPNGMVTLVTNRSRGYSYAVVDLSVPRKESPEQVFDLMRRVSSEMRKDPVLGVMMLDDVDIAGVEKVEDASFSVRCRLKVLPSKQWRIRREFLERMKKVLDEVKQVPA